MPTTTEAPRADLVERTFKALQTGHDHIEDVVFLLEHDVEKGQEDANSIPPVTFELIGVVASIGADVDRHLAEMREFKHRLANAVDALTAIRDDQQLKGNDGH